MRHPSAALRILPAAIVLLAAPLAHAEDKGAVVPLSTSELQKVSPALAKYRQGVLVDLWKRRDLAPRDRSIVTVAALIARNQTIELADEIGRAVDNGVKPAELSEMMTHLAFYAGWPNAMAAATVAKGVFDDRGVSSDQLPAAVGDKLPLDEASEAKRKARVGELFGSVSPGLVQYTTDILFLDLWLRPALAPRDRSLVTVSALIATGQVAQVGFHLNKAMDNGLTKEEVAEMITQLGFYAGWPKAFSAMGAAKKVFEKRGN